MISVRRSAKTVNSLTAWCTRENRLTRAKLLLMPAIVTVPACAFFAWAGDLATMGILGTLTALCGCAAMVLVIRVNLDERRQERRQRPSQRPKAASMTRDAWEEH